MVPALLGLVSKVQTLLDRLTATRAGYLDRLDAAISTRAAASVWTSTVAGRIDAAISSRAAMPTTQTGFVNTTGLGVSTGEDYRYVNVTLTTAVSSVDNAVVLFDGPGHCTYNSEFTYYSAVLPCTARLTSTTNLRISTVGGQGANRITGRWQVIDYG